MRDTRGKHACQAHSQEWIRIWRRSPSGQRFITSWSLACTRSCCRASWIDTAPAWPSGTTRRSSRCSLRSCGEEHHEEYIEIRQRSDARLVTLVDVVSPANKASDSGRQAYLAKRREGKSAGANLVEIDLVLQGQPMLDYSREGLPDWDYAVTVTRATQPDRFEIYTATLQKRLPRFRLPLASDDRDTVIDLYTIFTRSFDQGSFAAKINYQRDPPMPLTDEKRRWLDEWLKQHKLR